MPSSEAATRVASLDHLVLTVRNLESTIQWYETVLGMTTEVFCSVATPDVKRYSLKFGSQKINLHRLGNEFEPKACHVQAGSGDLCFITHDDIYQVRQRLVDKGIEIVDLRDEKTDQETVMRTGARGQLRSVYCRDPDGNLVEISNYVE